MSLPIIRLNKTSRHNATLTSDPLRSHATLYSFIHSTPTPAEIALAMDDFRDALHCRRQEEEANRVLTGATYFGSGSRAIGYTSLSGEEEALRQRVEAALVHGVLRQPPQVLPSRCQQSSAWRALFQPQEISTLEERQQGHASSPPSPRHPQQEERPQQQQQQQHQGQGSSPVSQPSEASSPYSERLLVQTEALKQYMTPYEVYHEAHGLPISTPVAASTSPSPLSRRHQTHAREGEDEELDTGAAPLQHSGSTQAPDTVSSDTPNSSPKHRQAEMQTGEQDAFGNGPYDEDICSEDTEPQGGLEDRRGYGTRAGDNPSAPSSVGDVESLDEAYGQAEESNDDYQERSGAKEEEHGEEQFHDDAEMPALCTTADAEGTAHHPLLTLLARQLQQPSQRRDDGLDEANAAPSTHSTAITARAAQVMQRLTGMRSAVANAMEAYEAEEGSSMWSPSFTYMKNAAQFVAELQERAQAADNLHRVEAYEKETIETAQSALLMEVMTMKLLLRDVQRAIDDCAATYLEEDRTPNRRESTSERRSSTRATDAGLISDLLSVLAPFNESGEL